MKKFSLYYTDERIISYLCKIRVAYAQKRNKKHLLNNLTSKKYHSRLEEQIDEYDKEILNILEKILPKRRLWVTLDKNAIYENGIKLNSIEKNKKCLLYTIKKYRKQTPQLPFITELDKFIKDIKDTIESKSYTINKPSVLPEPKETNKSKINLELNNNKHNECRPISRFSLKDRIILSITNKFLTKLFDGYFEESSLAFRSVNFVDKIAVVKNHHTAIQKIIKYKKEHLDINLSVAECDMKKFYDSVNHKVCIIDFNKLIDKAQVDYPNLELSTPIHIFNEYLKCYSFQENVLTLNDSEEYWESYQKGFKGRFPWITDEVANSEYYKQNLNDRIGVPQGGALSGLIANIVLNEADKELKNINDLFYIRYCDDMVLMHPDEKTCQLAVQAYVEMVNNKHLFTHPFKNNFSETNKNYVVEMNLFETKNNLSLNKSYEKTIKGFWKGKSKGPYKWGQIDIPNNVFPWIGFVGYEIKYNCNTRVRIRSLKKEVEKQKRVVQNILKAVRHKKVVVNNTILKSAYEKLNGMSVGRVEMFNYKHCKHEMCWAVGFQNLNFNMYSKRQLKFLDRNKYKQIHRLKKKFGSDIILKNKRDGKDDNNEILNYHKPFSYYYQAGEKKK